MFVLDLTEFTLPWSKGARGTRACPKLPQLLDFGFRELKFVTLKSSQLPLTNFATVRCTFSSPFSRSVWHHFRTSFAIAWHLLLTNFATCWDLFLTVFASCWHLPLTDFATCPGQSSHPGTWIIRSSPILIIVDLFVLSEWGIRTAFTSPWVGWLYKIRP